LDENIAAMLRPVKYESLKIDEIDVDMLEQKFLNIVIKQRQVELTDKYRRKEK